MDICGEVVDNNLKKCIKAKYHKRKNLIKVYHYDGILSNSIKDKGNIYLNVVHSVH